MTGYTYYNDNNSFCCDVLRKNINAGNLPEGYVDERDIRELHATDFMEYSHVHLFAGIGVFALGLHRAGYPLSLRTLTGGFPCTDISNAGKREGIEGSQSGLWKQMYRLIQEAAALHTRFDYILVENVSALTHRGLGTVLADLAEAGYDAVWGCLRASDFGAPHQRERIFIVAYPGSLVVRTRADFAGSLGEATASEDSKGSHTFCNTPACSSASLADTSGSGRQELDVTPITGASRHAAWCNLAPGETGLVEDSTSRRERQHPTTRSEEGTQSFTLQSSAGNAQSGMGRDANGLTAKLDEHRGVKDENSTREILSDLWNENGTQEKRTQWEAGGLSAVHETEILQPDLSGDRQQNRESIQDNDLSPVLPIQGGSVQELWKSGVSSCSSSRQESSQQRSIKPGDLVQILSYEMAYSEWRRTVEETTSMQSLRQTISLIRPLRQTCSSLQEIWQSLSLQEKSWVAYVALGGRIPWPAPPGHEQYPYEPSRIITEKQQNRVARLKALGNAIVVPCVEYIGRCLVQREMDSVA